MTGDPLRRRASRTNRRRRTVDTDRAPAAPCTSCDAPASTCARLAGWPDVRCCDDCEHPAGAT